jgi:CubicO group peptidase (beta-lactamase class C family)
MLAARYAHRSRTWRPAVDRQEASSMPLFNSRLIVPRIRPSPIVMAVAMVAMAAASPAWARWSDPVRNLHPEEPVAPTDVQHPIHYVLPLATAADPVGVSPEGLLQEFLDKHTALNYPAAAEAALRLINLVPERPAGHYNLACAMARMQRSDEAIDALKLAVERGWRDALHLRIDPDLASLRSDERFAAIVKEVQALAEAERIAPAPLRSDEWSAVAADLSRAVPPLLERYHVPGVAVALIEDGQVVWTSAFGIRDARDEDALGVDDLFRLRAPLHVLAIAACGQLERDNKVQLATLIREAADQYALTTALPELRGAGDQPLARPATVRNNAEKVRNSREENRQEHTGSGDAAGSQPPPRLRSYSRGSVYGLLRLAVEAATGDNFPRYCEAAILQPLGLRQTTFATSDDGESAAVGHSYLGTPLRPSVIAGEFSPGGSLYTTAGDLARLIAQTMDPPRADRKVEGIFMEEDELRGHGPAVACVANDSAIAQRASMTHALDLVTRVDAALPGGLGLAVQRNDSADGVVEMELGESASGIVCLARWHPHTRRGIVVLANSATARDAAERIAHTALGGQ